MADDYEREFMAGDGEVLHRQKAAIPRWAIGLAAGMPAAAGAVVGLIFAGALPLLGTLAILGGSALYGALMTALMVVVGVSRILVSEGELNVQMGVGGVQIPIGEIESVEVGDSRMRAVGMGKRILLDGTRVYNMFGNPKRALLVKHAGRSTTLVCREPEAALEAIQEAQRRASSAKIRVQAPDEEVEEEIPASSADDAQSAEQR